MTKKSRSSKPVSEASSLPKRGERQEAPPKAAPNKATDATDPRPPLEPLAKPPSAPVATLPLEAPATPPSGSSLQEAGVLGWKEWWSLPSLTGDGIDDRLWRGGLLVLACLLFLPQLGYGLWDCWEPHYAETARMMIVRGDWLHPYWSYAYFHSKPALMFWLMASSMSLFGMTETAIRLPFALHAIFLVWVVYFTASRLFTLRVGLFAAAILATAPLTTFLGRQALSDILVVSYLTAAIGFFALAVFGSQAERRAADAEGRLPRVHRPYLAFFYFFIGLSLLAKGFLGAGLAGLVIVGYLLLSFDLGLLLRVSLPSGIALALLIALPWYLHMSFFPGRNIDDHKTFFNRFVLYDNIYRVFGGVHGERGDFVYFIRQIGYALGLWIGLLPIALFSLLRFRHAPLFPDALAAAPSAPSIPPVPPASPQTSVAGASASPSALPQTSASGISASPQTSGSSAAPEESIALFPIAPIPILTSEEKLRRYLASWWLFTFLFLSLSQTKFHHYIFPLLPASAILIGLWLDIYLRKTQQPLLRFSLLFALAFTFLVFNDVIRDPKNFVNLFVYKYERLYPSGNPGLLFGGAPLAFSFFGRPISIPFTPELIFRDLFVLLGFAFSLSFLSDIRRYAVIGAFVTAGLLAFYNVHFFMIKLTPHWSQKPLFEALKKDSPLWRKLLSEPWSDARKEPVPDEPLIAFRMNWRGEVFYSGNRDIQMMGTNSYQRLYDLIERYRKPGRPVYFLIENTRYKELERGVGSYESPRLKIIDRSGNKYYLVKLPPPPPTYRPDPTRIRQDNKDRKYYDDWNRDWLKKKRTSG